MKLLVLRHGPTAWNDAGRIQGHTDVPLSRRAVELLGVRAMPPATLGWRWYASPLQRARHTAALLGVASVHVDPRLREMRWGEWEGCTRADVHERYGVEAVARLTDRGLDFRPPGGESPREVQARLRAWLGDIVARPRDSGAVAHKGVLRALLGLALDWDLQGKMPVKLDWSRAHRFEVSGTPEAPRFALDQPNVPFERLDGGDPEAPVDGW